MIQFLGQGAPVEIRSPDFGNRIRLPLRVVAHRAMSGERYTYITRPVKAIHTLSFSHLNNNQVEQMRTFIINNMGRYIQYNEIEIPEEVDRFHTARILDNAVDFVTRGRRNNVFTLNLEVGDYA